MLEDLFAVYLVFGIIYAMFGDRFCMCRETGKTCNCFLKRALFFPYYIFKKKKV